MAGIAGIGRPGEAGRVREMLKSIAHRGPAGSEVYEGKHSTIGMVWPEAQLDLAEILRSQGIASDDAGPGHLASAQEVDGRIVLKRDQLGVAPLYHGKDEHGSLCFASEVRALLPLTGTVSEFPPGHRLENGQPVGYFDLREQEPVDDPVDVIAAELKRRLADGVASCISGESYGSWLSGGLDSSTMAALARPHVSTLHTFAAGLTGAPDLDYAREVADYIKAEHHVALVTLDDLIRALPVVIFHLESFDALLVRSSLMNYLVAKLAGDYVGSVFSGEGGDELFAGYEYLKSLPPASLPGELVDITGRLHNTALQRVDRSASAHGTVAHVVFTHPDVVDYALRIPSSHKLKDGVEKYILREAMIGELPGRVLTRTKAKFWEGAGVGDLLARRADTAVTDYDFNRERVLPNGWKLSTKEELMYYRYFREHFGDLADLSWMGRTKGAPEA